MERSWRIKLKKKKENRAFPIIEMKDQPTVTDCYAGWEVGREDQRFSSNLRVKENYDHKSSSCGTGNIIFLRSV